MKDSNDIRTSIFDARHDTTIRPPELRELRVKLSDAIADAIAQAASGNFLCALCLYVPKKPHEHDLATCGRSPEYEYCDDEGPDDRIVIIGGYSSCVDHAGYFSDFALSRLISMARKAQQGGQPS